MDLAKFNVRTDLVVELIADIKETEVFKHTKKQYQNIEIDYVEILEDDNALGKQKGDYVSISFSGLDDEKEKEALTEVLETNLVEILKKYDLVDHDKILVVGLGNRDVIADALGPMVVDDIIITNHIYELLPNNVHDNMKAIAAISPGVMGKTGIETSNIVKAVVNTYHPKVVIVVDALAARDINRVNKTIQITNTGIAPGSGVGNQRLAINEKEIGCPIVAIGIPTVVDMVTIGHTIIGMMDKYFASLINNPKQKLMVTNAVYDKELDKQTRQEIFGEIGKLSDQEKRQLLFEALNPVGLNMVVTPKQIDETVYKLTAVVAKAINKTLIPEIENM